ncbi:hypothetical protein CQ054_22675 [Ochrobactrum sp. MYb29]|nr:hypothetical protein CQ054_22675 [Ochrobactrum sp. MYb29]
MSNCYSQITLAERRRLFELKQLKVPLGDIARLMRRHRSTIYREIKRNQFNDDQITDLNGYYCTIADQKARERRSKQRKLIRFDLLRQSVIQHQAIR